MISLEDALKELCDKENIDIGLLQELIKIEKANLTSSRGSAHKASLEQVVRKYL